MKNIDKRLELINQLDARQMSVKISDNQQSASAFVGTRVEIRFPI